MPYLALEVAEGSELGNGRALIAVDERISHHAFAKLDETVLIYRHVPAVMLDFIGAGRVAGVNLSPEGQRLVTIDPYTPFNSPVVGEGELRVPGARRFLEIDDERYQAIVTFAERPAFSELAEQATPFIFDDAPTVDTYLAIHDQVLRAWSYRCCVTGARFKAGGRPHADLRVVAIQPRDRGGPLHVKNYLPMVDLAERSWSRGAISVGADDSFVAQMNRLDADLLEAMPESGKLIVPGNPDDRPDPDLLAWHRANVFGRG